GDLRGEGRRRRGEGRPRKRAPQLTDDPLANGLELIRAGEFFSAHEELEDAWRSAEPAERDFLQGLVHVAVAWYQAGRGNRVGCERQLEKAQRRLGPYAPQHRDVDVAALLDQLRAAADRTSRAGRSRRAGRR